MKRNFIDDAEDHITEHAVRDSATNVIPAQSVLLVTRSGILQHSLPIAINTREVAINQDLKALTPYNGIDAEFVAGQFRADAQAILADCAKAGTTVDSVDFTRLKNRGFRLAPFDEQRRIVAKLDHLLARTARARADLDRIPILIAHYKQTLLTAAFSGEMTRKWRELNPSKSDAKSLAARVHDIHQSAGGHKAGNAAPPTEGAHDLTGDMFPDGWALLALRDLVSPDRPITYGILKPGPDLEAGIPYVRVADFPNERLILSSVRRTSAKIDQEFKRSRLRCGDLLLSIRGTVGRLVVVPDELEGANITQDTARLSITSLVNSYYVLWYLRSKGAQTRMQRAIKGVAVRGINIGDVRALQVPLPSSEEQEEIVRRITAAFAWLDGMAAEHTRAAHLLPKLDQAISAKAFSGELVPQDPRDEPASELLARIRATRGEQPNRRRARKPRSDIVPRAPRERAAMTKSRYDDDVRNRPYLADLLRQTTDSGSVEDLFKRADLTVADFYKQLKWEVDSGHIHDKKERLEAA
jgi:type I restriction enzyme S subunit